MLRFSTMTTIAALLLTASPALAAVQGLLAVSANVVGKGKCTLATPPPLNFGNLDGFNPVDISKTVTLSISCTGIGNSGTTFVVEVVNPMPPGTPTLKHTTPPSSAYIPYAIDLPQDFFAEKNKSNYSLTITGTVKGIDYELAPLGGYTDSITLQVTP